MQVNLTATHRIPPRKGTVSVRAKLEMRLLQDGTVLEIREKSECERELKSQGKVREFEKKEKNQGKVREFKQVVQT